MLASFLMSQWKTCSTNSWRKSFGLGKGMVAPFSHAADILSNWEGSSRMRVQRLLIIQAQHLFEPLCKLSGLWWNPLEERNAVWEPGGVQENRRFQCPNHPTDKGGQSFRRVHFNLIFYNHFFISLKFLQKSLRHLILLHLLKWLRVSYCLWYEARSSHNSLKNHSKGELRWSPGIIILNHQKFPLNLSQGR